MYGDHLEVRRKAIGVFPYNHHGTEMPGEVIYENTWPAGVRSVSFEQFSRGTPVKVLNPAATPKDRAASLARAESRLGEHRYNLLANNCEHFANWCATGVAVSYQVAAFFTAVWQFLQALVAAGACLLAGAAVAAVLAE